MPSRPRSRSDSAPPADGSVAVDRPTDPSAELDPASAAADRPDRATSAPTAGVTPAPQDTAPSAVDGIDDLSFRDAQVALELVLSQLQASDLDVEAMVELHRRGQAYAERCETVLRGVEQEVLRWDPDAPDQEAIPYLDPAG